MLKPSPVIVLLLLSTFLFTSCKVKKMSTGSHGNRPVQSELYGLDISKKLKKEIEDWLGVPYRYGGRDKKGIDCSGLICVLYQSVYKIEMAKTVRLQYMACKKIPLKKLREGDLVFFNPESKEVTHVGLYLTNHQFVHASVSKGVVISSLENTYYKKCVVCGGRP
jgi:cell wall-associated NlpC family hydrolase